MLKARVKLFLPNTNIWDLDGASECVWNIWFCSCFSISYSDRCLLLILPLKEGFLVLWRTAPFCCRGTLTSSPADYSKSISFLLVAYFCSNTFRTQKFTTSFYLLMLFLLQESLLGQDLMTTAIDLYPMLPLTPSGPSWGLSKTFVHPVASVRLEIQHDSKADFFQFICPKLFIPHFLDFSDRR